MIIGINRLVSNTTSMLIPSIPAWKRMPKSVIQGKFASNCVLASGIKLAAMNKVKTKEVTEITVEIILADLPAKAVMIAPASGRNISSKSCSII